MHIQHFGAYWAKPLDPCDMHGSMHRRNCLKESDKPLILRAISCVDSFAEVTDHRCIRPISGSTCC